MNVKRLSIIAALMLTVAPQAFAQIGHKQQVRKLVRQGNRQYRADKRQEASVTYIKAFQTDSTYAPAVYNYATSLFPRQWQQLDTTAIKNQVPALMKAAELEENPIRKAQAYHNIGVLYQGAQDYGTAIEAYKQALRNNPNDDESRYNLAVCKKQQKDNPQDQNQQGQDQDQNGDQQKQDQQQQQQDQQKQDQQQDQQQQQEPPMSKENAEQLLQAAMQQEKKTQDRLKDAQKQPQRRLIEKNW